MKEASFAIAQIDAQVTERPSAPDPFTTLYELLKPAHLESFMHALAITEMSAADIIAAETELRCRVALQLESPHSLNKEEAILAWRQHQCRVEHNGPHACRPLLYRGPHATCDHS